LNQPKDGDSVFCWGPASRPAHPPQTPMPGLGMARSYIVTRTCAHQMVFSIPNLSLALEFAKCCSEVDPRETIRHDVMDGRKVRDTWDVPAILRAPTAWRSRSQ
jgi:hypothetical protein